MAPNELSLPNFLVLGAKKCGTTSMHDLLGRHPDIYMSDEKEINFFNDRARRERGLAWYAEHFGPGADAAVRGESTTNYAWCQVFPEVPRHIYGALGPDVRFLYLVRDPMARLRSNYVQMLVDERKNAESLTWRTFTQAPELMHMSMYATQLEAFASVFGDSSILVLDADDVRRDPTPALRRVADFLGVDPDGWGAVTEPPRLNETAQHRLYSGRFQALRRSAPGRVAERCLGRSPIGDALSRWGRRRAAEQVAAPLEPEVEAHLREVFRTEVEGLRRWMPPDFDGWGWLSDARAAPAAGRSPASPSSG